MSEVSVGGYVRVIGRRDLEAALRAANPLLRPEPPQSVSAGRVARVIAVHFDRERNPRYRLEGLPGFWREAWLLPLVPRLSTQPTRGLSKQSHDWKRGLVLQHAGSL